MDLWFGFTEETYGLDSRLLITVLGARLLPPCPLALCVAGPNYAQTLEGSSFCGSTARSRS